MESKSVYSPAEDRMETLFKSSSWGMPVRAFKMWWYTLPSCQKQCSYQEEVETPISASGTAPMTPW